MKPASALALALLACSSPLAPPADADAAPDAVMVAPDAAQLDAAPATPDAPELPAPEFPPAPALPWCFSRFARDTAGVTVSVLTLCEEGRTDTSVGIDVLLPNGDPFGTLYRGASCGETVRVRFPFFAPSPSPSEPVFVFVVGNAFGAAFVCQDLDP